MDRIRKDFTTITWVMIPVAIAINMALGFIVFSLKIPFLYLDSIGTILVGLLCGPIAGLLTGALSNFAWGLLGNPGYVPYFPVGALIGLLAGLFGQWGWYKQWWLWIFGGGLITALAGAVLSAPINAYLQGGVTGSGTDVLVAAFRAGGASILQASFFQGLITESVDKVVNYAVVWAIVKALPVRFLARFPRYINVRPE